jgi:hypothetical protein
MQCASVVLLSVDNMHVIAGPAHPSVRCVWEHVEFRTHKVKTHTFKSTPVKHVGRTDSYQHQPARLLQQRDVARQRLCLSSQPVSQHTASCCMQLPGQPSPAAAAGLPYPAESPSSLLLSAMLLPYTHPSSGCCRARYHHCHSCGAVQLPK